MTGPSDREQSWRDQLPADELAVTDRLRGMTPQMQSAWLGVEIFRVRKDVRALADTLQTTLRDSNKATADAIVAGVTAANPRKNDWTLTAAQRAWFMAAGGSLALGAGLAGKALGLL